MLQYFAASPLLALALTLIPCSRQARRSFLTGGAATASCAGYLPRNPFTQERVHNCGSYRLPHTPVFAGPYFSSRSSCYYVPKPATSGGCFCSLVLPCLGLPAHPFFWACASARESPVSDAKELLAKQDEEEASGLRSSCAR